jgi:cell division protein FtsZ
LKDNEIEGARYILLNISSGEKEVTMDEVSIITDYIQEEAGLSADLIWGNCRDENLGDKLSVTIIATGFQTKDEREKEHNSKKVVSMLVPDAPLVRPVNEFITPVTEAAATTSTPYLKHQKEEQAQTGLFDLFAAKPQASEDEAGTVRYNLQEEEPVAQAEESDVPEFTFKLSEPSALMDMQIEDIQEEEEEEPVQEAIAPVALKGADDNKTDESIEEQLRKSRERIMRLKDLSMKLRSGNIQEMENVPAYKRKEIALQEPPPSNETQVSRFSLLPDDEGRTGIRNNNSFLHDNVD